MDLYRPLCEISDNDLLSRLKALSAQGMTEDEIAKTQEGQERYFRSLTDMQIIDICNQKMSQPGMTLSDIPEFSVYAVATSPMRRPVRSFSTSRRMKNEPQTYPCRVRS